ncbi:MAG: NifB/NifX family molybdenum-iron cluster-binding protein [Phycisphaerae bacterium]|jgi:predicted Fe-Mo cluster-binding NifX family protein
MKIGVAAADQTLDAQVSERFGRCPWFLIVESEDMSCTAHRNPAADMPGGAGPAAVQELIRLGAQVVLAGEFGPKADHALRAANIRFEIASGPIRDAIANLKL